MSDPFANIFKIEVETTPPTYTMTRKEQLEYRVRFLKSRVEEAKADLVRAESELEAYNYIHKDVDTNVE